MLQFAYALGRTGRSHSRVGSVGGVYIGGVGDYSSKLPSERSPTAMKDFFDTQLFGATCAGFAMVATCYVAGASGWWLVILPLLVMIGYHLCFSGSGRLSEAPREFVFERGGPRPRLTA